MERNSVLATRAMGWLTLAVWLSSVCTARVIYVDDDAAADFTTIQAAIDAAIDGDTVFLAPGLYAGDGNRDLDFRGKAITVKSQDGPETCIIDAGGRRYISDDAGRRWPINDPDADSEPHRGFHFHSGEDANSVVQGLTIAGGYLRWGRGGGIYCDNASPQIVGCVVTANAAHWGGGIAISDSNAVIVDCTILGNRAEQGSGGGVSMGEGNPTLRNCLIAGNFADDNAGGIRTDGADFVLRNCTICENRTSGWMGGGLYCSSGAWNRGILDNCILWSNESRDGYRSEIVLGGGILGTIHLELNHCVVQDSQDSVDDDVYGIWASTDPCFVRPGYWDPNGTPGRLLWDDFWVKGDYHLKSRAGRWDPTTATWVRDDVSSPCIDAGDPRSPIGDEPSPNGGVINIGFYGGTAQASKSYPTSTRVLYVDDGMANGGDGSSWTRAYAFLQDALAAANPRENPIEIRVAQGRYTPDLGAAVTPGDRGAAFQLTGRMTLLGGYAGATAPDPNERDLGRYETILSGDLENNDDPATLPLDLPADPTRADNSHTIAAMDGYELFPCVLDGFTLEVATQSPALLVRFCSPSIANCRFTDNASGAVTVDTQGGHPQFINCRFSRNAALNGGAIHTSAARRWDPSPARFTLKKCIFADNYAAEAGGAILLRTYDALSLQHCFFVRNSARLGGAVFLQSWATANMANCLFAGNWATECGGGVYLEDTVLDIACCTFAGNRATSGRAVAGPRYASSGSITAVNTVLRDGGDELSNVVPSGRGTYSSPASITYSNVEGGRSGEGNIDADPLFADPGYWDANGTPADPNDDFFVEGDYHLKSEAGRWDVATQGWVLDDVTSPCIDAGDPASAIDNEPAPHGGRINMGAYGGTAQASKSTGDEP